MKRHWWTRLAPLLLLGSLCSPAVAYHPPAALPEPAEILTPPVLEDSIREARKTDPSLYLVGCGIHDITGPAAEVTMGGFAVSEQKTSGIAMRLWSRAFIAGDGKNRVAFVSADTWALDIGAMQEILRLISKDPELAPFYSEKNVCVSATHTHSAVGGFSHYFLYNVPNKGFIKDSFFAVTRGVVESIRKAHRNLEIGRIRISEGSLDNAGWNRAEGAYNNNPQWEREEYATRTDDSMVLLKFEGKSGTPLGMVNWYAVHPDTVGPENTLINGDSKGHASWMVERRFGTDYQRSKTFVAAFAQANSGDNTPNVPFTEKFGSAETAAAVLGISVAEAKAFGFPIHQAYGEPDITKNPILAHLANRQADMALSLFDSAERLLVGPIDSRQRYRDFSTIVIAETGEKTCAAGMGASYSSGSPADNPSPYPLFPDGITNEELQKDENLKLRMLKWLLGGIIAIPWPEAADDSYLECQAPKPVILPTGLASLNFGDIPMTPQVLPVQVLRIGDFGLTALPFEITSMAGRRLKETARDRMPGNDPVVALSCLANGYASYMATFEEYQKQSYAAGGTFFGPHQLAACRQETGRLWEAMEAGISVENDILPEDLSENQHNFTTGVVLDDKPLFDAYGDVEVDVKSDYQRGDLVSATFWGGHPRNTLTTMMDREKMELFPFAVVEMKTDRGWIPVRHDWDPDTFFEWKRSGISWSKCTIGWNTKTAEPGTYRLRIRGHEKSGWSGRISPYEGISSPFILR